MEVAVREYFQTSPNLIDVMIHNESCSDVRRFFDERNWRRFTSIREARDHYGELAFVCKRCLYGQGPHLERRR